MSERYSQPSRRGDDRPPHDEMDRRDRPKPTNGRDRDRDRERDRDRDRRDRDRDRDRNGRRDRDRDRDNNARFKEKDRDRDHRRYRSRSPDRRARNGERNQEREYGRDRRSEFARDDGKGRPPRHDEEGARGERDFPQDPRGKDRKRDRDGIDDRKDGKELFPGANSKESRRRSASPRRSPSQRRSRSPRIGGENDVAANDASLALPRREKPAERTVVPAAPVSFKVKGQDPHRDGNQARREHSWAAEQRGRSEERGENRPHENDDGRSGSRGRFDADPMDEDDGDDDIEVADDGVDAMQAMMGFGGFGSTKGQKVVGNNVGAVRKEKKTEYRQYMNRVGGFNRPLSPSR